MTELFLVVWRVSEIVTSAIRRALISVVIDSPKSLSSSLILAENITVSALFTELWRILERAKRNASGLFYFFFQPTEVIKKVQLCHSLECQHQFIAMLFLDDTQ